MTLRRIVAISDYCSHVPPEPPGIYLDADFAPERIAPDVPVAGGYLERLPLAVVRSGLCDAAEVWSFAGKDGHRAGLTQSPYGLGLRRFRADGHPAPYGSSDLLCHINAFGAPDILCVWGLGVTPAILDACSTSVTIYNSLDVDALRIPPEVSRYIDIFLTASAKQTDAVRARHPDALVAMLPIGPEFASETTFHPLPGPKEFDVVYVAAAQPYKRHDILFDALTTLPKSIRALCVMGYGEDADALRAKSAAMGLDVTFVGPPGVSHAEVNRLMNLGRIGVVCGVADGAPAILTEYMLAGLPVLANADLACGLQYIRPDTGRTATAAQFGAAILAMLADLSRFSPREAALRTCTWPHSMFHLMPLIERAQRSRRAGYAA